MCSCCPVYQVLPIYAQHFGLTYGYPPYGYGFPTYGLPFSYVYADPSPAGYYAGAPMYSRGEYRVGNCLMVCQ